MPQIQVNLFFDISVKSVQKAKVLLLRNGNGGLDDPAMSDVVALGLLPFLSFFIVPSGYRGFGIKALIAAPFIFANFCCISLEAFFSVIAIDVGIKSAIVFEHTVNDATDFVHAQSQGRLLFHSFFSVFQIDFCD